MIGSLLYFMASSLNIIFSVCLCARIQSNSKESHLSTIKRILRYLHDTMNLGLWYLKGTHFEITSYLDADFSGYQTDRKSTSSTCHCLGYALVPLFRKKQNSVALSTTDSKYISTASCCAHYA